MKCCQLPQNQPSTLNDVLTIKLLNEQKKQISQSHSSNSMHLGTQVQNENHNGKERGKRWLCHTLGPDYPSIVADHLNPFKPSHKFLQLLYFFWQHSHMAYVTKHFTSQTGFETIVTRQLRQCGKGDFGAATVT